MQHEPILLKNARILTPYRLIDGGSLLLEEGKIAEVKDGNIIETPRGVRVLDVQNNFVTPGFIDIHLHGGGGSDTMDSTYEALNTISVARRLSG